MATVMEMGAAPPENSVSFLSYCVPLSTTIFLYFNFRSSGTITSKPKTMCSIALHSHCPWKPVLIYSRKPSKHKRTKQQFLLNCKKFWCISWALERADNVDAGDCTRKCYESKRRLSVLVQQVNMNKFLGNAYLKVGWVVDDTSNRKGICSSDKGRGED